MSHETSSVGPSEDFDIYIGDWDAQSIELAACDESSCQASWPQSDGDMPVDGAVLEEGVFRCLLQEWVPVRFGTVILCMGSADSPWPSDADLLQRLFAPPPPTPLPAVPPVRAISWRKRSILMLAGASVMAAATSAAVIAGSRGAQKPLVVAMSKKPLVMVREALADERFRSLEVQDAFDTLTVRGVLDRREDVAETHRRLNALTLSKPLARRFVSAEEITDLIYESMPRPGFAVSRANPHTFEVVGHAAESQRTRQTVARLNADFQSMGAQLVLSLAPTTTPTLSRISGTLIDRDGVSFARTRDGVKLIVMPGDSLGSPVTPVTPAIQRQLAQ